MKDKEKSEIKPMQNAIENSNQPQILENSNSKPLNLTFEDWDHAIKERENEYNDIYDKNVLQTALGTDISSINDIPKWIPEVQETQETQEENESQSDEGMIFSLKNRRNCSNAKTRKVG